MRLRRLSAILLMLLTLVLPDCSTANKPSPRESATERLRSVRFWAYQIQDQEKAGAVRRLAASKYDMFVIDQTRSLKGSENYAGRRQVQALRTSRGVQGKRKLVLAYVDVGEAESYRWYWRRGWSVGRPDWIVAEDPDGWDENFPVKFWRPEWKAIVRRYIDRVIDDDYDGAYLDWLEIYSFPPVAAAARAEGLDLRRELVDFVEELASHARSRKPGFILIAQNAAEMGASRRYRHQFDAIAQEAIWYDGAGDPDIGRLQGDVRTPRADTKDYLADLGVWQRAGKPVFDVEYAENARNAARAYRLGNARGFKTYVTTRTLDRLSETPPPGYR